jgi:hypothetical protein
MVDADPLVVGVYRMAIAGALLVPVAFPIAWG